MPIRSLYCPHCRRRIKFVAVLPDYVVCKKCDRLSPIETVPSYRVSPAYRVNGKRLEHGNVQGAQKLKFA